MVESDNQKTDGSYLLYQLNKLSIASKESTISNSYSFDAFTSYMHVDRKIQDELIAVIEDVNSKNKGHLILLTGSSGDGKSHLFTYLNQNKPDLVRDYNFILDATESEDPHKDSEEILEIKLRDFSDEALNTPSNSKLLVAINLGILNRFISRESVQKRYTKLLKFINDSKILDSGQTCQKFHSDNFTLVNFPGYNDLEFDEKGEFTSKYYIDIFNKVFDENPENIFYAAYKRDFENGCKLDCVSNYELMLNPAIRAGIIKLVIMAKITHNLIIPTRLLYDFIYSILVPPYDSTCSKAEIVQSLKNSLPNLLLNNSTKSKLMEALHNMDILKNREKTIDDIVAKIYSESDLSNFFSQFFFEENASILNSRLIRTITEHPDITSENMDTQIVIRETICRILWIGNFIPCPEYYAPYNEYVKSLFGYNKADRDTIRKIIVLIRKGIYMWCGDVASQRVFTMKSSQKIQVSFELSFNDNMGGRLSELEGRDSTLAPLTIMDIDFANPLKRDSVETIKIDYNTFRILYLVEQGYHPNKRDSNDLLPFLGVANRLIANGQITTNKIYLYNTDSKFVYSLEKKENLGESEYVFTKV